MAMVKPFAAVRPKPELASQICELPYDVMSSDEARAIADGNRFSFLHVSKPEIDLPPETDVHAPEVYVRGRENFQKLVHDGALKPDTQPCFYLYRQVMGSHVQTGLVAAASCEEYQRGIIRKHEQTRVDKENDRVRHIETLNAQTSPVFLAYPAVRALDAFIAEKTSGRPEIDFTAGDGVRHLSWTIQQPHDLKFIETQFVRVPHLYIADGHHRSAAAARIYQTRQGAGESGRFLAVIFPHNQVRILPYHRVLKDLNGWTPEQMLEILGAIFAIDRHGAAVPGREHELGLYLAGRWHTLMFRRQLLEARGNTELLDVALLQEHVLGPIFGIEDPRTNQRIQFVGGIRGTAELEKLVGSGEFACAFSLFPLGVETLMAISDAGGVMPPKSTWFEPKLRDGMFCHLI
ncbi:MAG TPA: DUF1015 family protein [Candidatus Sulfopaludibacter sp.]|nr:DUF1015 family protein [Candidatus Sulfopaludibacter sp.]